MTQLPLQVKAQVVLAREHLQQLLDVLHHNGYQVVGPTVRDRAIVYDTLTSVADLPIGYTDEQDGGTYRLKKRADKAMFGYAVGPHSWKKFLHPPVIRLWQAKREGEYIFREGEDASRFYIIREGKVALETVGPRPEPITIQTVEAGEVLGWSWLFPPYRWHFSARVVEQTRAIALDGVCLRTKGEEDHDLGYELVKRVAQVMMERLQATRLQLLDVYGAPNTRGGL